MEVYTEAHTLMPRNSGKRRQDGEAIKHAVPASTRPFIGGAYHTENVARRMARMRLPGGGVEPAFNTTKAVTICM